MVRVPVFYVEQDTLIHRRDPRVKLLWFILLIAILYMAPGWPWMVALTLLGLIMAALARVPMKWLVVLWLIQLPNFLGLVIIPIGKDLFVGNLAVNENLAFGLRLGFAWMAALFISISLFSTMRVEELTDGLRGVGVPSVICFAVGYSFLLLYLSLNDIFRITDAMKIKGIRLETKNPIRLMLNLPRLMIPAIFTIVRRATTMMAVLQMRGFSFTKSRKKLTLPKFDLGDAAFLMSGLLVFGLVLGAQLDLSPLDLSRLAR